MGSAAKTLQEIRSEACNAILIASTLLAVPAVAFSLLRWFEQGWRPEMSVHVAVLLVLAWTTVQRRSLSLNIRAAVATAVPYIVATSGLIASGRGNGVMMFYVSAVVTAGCFFERRVAAAVIGLCVVSIAAIYAGAQLDILPVPFTPSAFDMTPLSWIAFSIGFIAAGLGPLIGLSALLRMLDIERQRADEAATVRSDFLANMSHELRTPLTGILGVADVLQTTPLNHQQKGLIANLTLSARQLLGVFNDVLEFAKYDTGEVPIDAAPFGVAAAVQNVCAQLEAKAAQKGISLRTELKEMIADQVVGDASRLGQVLTRLVDNAVSFTNRGSVVVRASQTARDDGDLDLTCSIADTGIGITPEQIERIFEPFIQADMSTSRMHGGTGLGLSISRKLTEAMGGRLTVTSRPGAGSTFTLTIPVRRDASPALTAARAVEAPSPHAWPRPPSGKRLLLADDDKNMRTLAEIMLERRGYHVTLAEDGAAAVAAAAAEVYDCIIVDMHMPAMSGVEVMRTIQASEIQGAGRRTPMIALTADVLPEHVRNYVDAGADAVVEKPVGWSQLDAKIRALTRAGQTAQAS